MGKNVIIFGVNMSSSGENDSNKKDILILGKILTQRLDDNMLTAEAQYSIIFSRWNRKLCLSLHNNGSNCFLFVNLTKMSIQNKKDKNILCV